MKTIFLKLYKIGSALWRIRDFYAGFRIWFLPIP